MILDSKSQAMKLGVLQKIKELMDSIEGGNLGKKPDAAIMTVKADALPTPDSKDPLAALAGGDDDSAGPDQDDDKDEDLKRLMAEYEARMK